MGRRGSHTALAERGCQPDGGQYSSRRLGSRAEPALGVGVVVTKERGEGHTTTETLDIVVTAPNPSGGWFQPLGISLHPALQSLPMTSPQPLQSPRAGEAWY